MLDVHIHADKLDECIDQIYPLYDRLAELIINQNYWESDWFDDKRTKNTIFTNSNCADAATPIVQIFETSLN